MAKPVLEGIGIGPALDFSELNRAFENQRRDRLARDQMKAEQQQRAESRKAGTASFLKSYIKQDDFNNTGTIYDGQITTDTQALINEGAKMIAQGADEAQLMLALGPKVAQIAQYSKKAKLINDQIMQSAQKLKEQDKGYNYDELIKAARENAFQDTDPTTGAKTRRPVDKLDDQTDWIAESIRKDPSRVTTTAALDELVDKSPMEEYSREVQTSHMGRGKLSKYEAKHPYYMDLERDASGEIATDDAGNPLGLGVRGGPITDDKNQPMINPETGKPYRGLEQRAFNAFTDARGSVKDWLRGQVKEHFQAVMDKDPSIKEMPREGSAQWDAMARSILHDELAMRKKSSFKVVDKDRESALAQKLAIAEKESSLNLIKKFGEASRKDTPPKEKKDNVVDSFVKIMKGDPNSNQGDVITKNGQKVIDVTTALPGGGLKRGRGEDEVFKGVFFNPKTGSFFVDQKVGTGFNAQDVTEEVKKKDVPKFLARIARANGVELNEVKEIMTKAGYNFETGDFSGATGNADLIKKMDDAESQQLSATKEANVKSFLEEKGVGGVEKLKDFKGSVVNGNTIQKISRNRGINDKYFDVTFKTPEGKMKKEGFRTKQEVVDFLQGKSGASAPAKGKHPLPAGKPRTVKQGGNTYTWNEQTGQYE